MAYHTGQIEATPATVDPVTNNAVEPMVATQEVEKVGPSPTPVKELSRYLMVSHHDLLKKREQSLLCRTAAEVVLGSEAIN